MDPAEAGLCDAYSEAGETACEEALITMRGNLAMVREPIPPVCGEAAPDACERALPCCVAHHTLLEWHPEDCAFGPSWSAAACEGETLDARLELESEGHVVPPECGGPAADAPSQ